VKQHYNKKSKHQFRKTNIALEPVSLSSVATTPHSAKI